MAEGSLRVMEGTTLDQIQVAEDLFQHIDEMDYDVRALGYGPYNSKEFLEQYIMRYGDYAIEKVIQGARTESVPLGEIRKLAESKLLLFDQMLMMFAMGNCITLEDTNGNRKLLKRRQDEKKSLRAAVRPDREED